MRNIRPYIIAMDGLDGVGKSTFTNNLYEYFKAKLADTNIVVIKQHFPVYENSTGRLIKLFLDTVADLKDSEKVDFMVEQQIKNRAEWWIDLSRHLEASKTNNYEPLDVVIIADRYKESNIIYNAFGHNSNNMRKRAFDIRSLELPYPQPDPVIQLFSFCDPKLQMKRLSERKSTDLYETKESVRILNDNYCQYIKWYNSYNINKIRTLYLPMHWFDESYTSAEYSPEDQYEAKVLSKLTYELILFMFAKITGKDYLLSKILMNMEGALVLQHGLARAWASYSNTVPTDL